ncbi:linear amide C-N hydrolase [Shewanella rhizosphaerae]|uniref:linear amide C-N hydrolase n=1 Tax=Shewanella rhizosphaerae TaxID=2864207 RepID=UPI001C65C272|nr:linear amide C-N hydrolase [Shewanella rhizosphaerae]QYK12325.1 linear amide C-N hydrolase [Shewanella rhizosphaerae]
MKKSFKKTAFALGLVASASLGAISSAQACLVYLGASNNEHPLIGRTVEFGFDEQTQTSFATDFINFPRESHFTTYGADKPLSWTNKYGFSGMAHDGLVSDGINEKGLYVAMLWFADGKYAPRDESKPSIASGSLGNWILSHYASVDEAVKGLSETSVYQSADNHLGIELPMHLQLVDKQGKAVVIEYIDGEMTVTDNSEFGVMTNSPKIGDHMVAYRELLDANPHLDVSKPSVKGMLAGLPGGYTAVERSVKTAVLKDLTPKPKTKVEAINQVIHTLNNTDYVKGASSFPSRGLSGGAQETSFITIIDMENNDYYYRTVDSQVLHKVDIDKVDYSQGNPVTSFDIYGGIQYIDVTYRVE